MRLLKALLAGAGVLYVVFLLVPLEATMPSGGLDPSWRFVLAEAFHRSWQWGRDIVYTCGPYGFVYSRLYHPDLYGALLAIWVGLALLIAAGFLRLVGSAPLAVAVPAFVALAFAVANELPDTVLLVVPLLVAETLLREGDRRFDAVTVASVVACALVALAKTTAGLFAAVVCLVVDAHRMLADRRAPAAVPVFAVAVTALYLLAGQDLRAVAPFVTLTASVVVGYADAMQTTGAGREIVEYLGLAAIVLGVGGAGAALRGDAAARRARAACRVAFLFLSFKAGFVRHDLHATIAWSCLGVLAVVTLVDRWRAGASWPVRGIAALAVVLCLAADVSWSSHYFGWSRRFTVKYHLVDRPLARLHVAVDALRDPAAWTAALHTRFDQALAAIRAAHPLPAFDGPVDIVPSEQGAVIAHGLDYRPLPVFQEFAVYTRTLIEANRHHLLGTDGPRTLLFSTETIDDRLPALVYGALWPDLARGFDPVATIGDLVVLRRRASPRPVRIGPAIALPARREREVDVPDLGGRPLWVTIELEKTLVGRLVGILFKSPIVQLRVRTAAGIRHTFRLVPAMAAAGFVLSPVVLRSVDALPVLTGERPAATDRVVALRVEVEPWGRGLYRRYFELRLAPFVVDAIPERAVASDDR